VKDDPTRGWSKQTVKGYVRDAIKENRAAWDLVPSLRTAIISKKYTSVVSNQGVDMISTLKLQNLWLDMLEAANLLGEG
jgi:hypothetical protein